MRIIFLIMLTLFGCKARNRSNVLAINPNNPDQFFQSDAERDKYVIEMSREPEPQNSNLITLVRPDAGLASLEKKDNGTQSALALDGGGSNSEAEATFALESSQSIQEKIGQIQSTVEFRTLLANNMLSFVSMVNGATSAERIDNYKKFLDAIEPDSSPQNSLMLDEKKIDPNELLKYIRTTAALNILKTNIIGQSREEKVAVFRKMEDILKPDTLKVSLNDAQKDVNLEVVKKILLKFAGADGYINFGDAVRITPAVPALVNEIGDQMIQEGYQQGMAELAANHPRLYRTYTTGRGGLISRFLVRRFVEPEVNARLSAAYSQKWQAVNDAGQKTEELFVRSMQAMGVQRFFVNDDTTDRLRDPQDSLTSNDLRELAAALHISLDASAASSAGGINGAANQILATLSMKVQVPDGVPIAELVRVRELQEKGQQPIPEALAFRLSGDGAIAMTQKREPCECKFDSSDNSCGIFFKIKYNKGYDPNVKYSYSVPAPEKKCTQKLCDDVLAQNNPKFDLTKTCGYSYTLDNKIRHFKKDDTLEKIVPINLEYTPTGCSCVQYRYSDATSWCVMDHIGKGFSGACTQKVCDDIYQSNSNFCLNQESMPWTREIKMNRKKVDDVAEQKRLDSLPVCNCKNYTPGGVNWCSLDVTNIGYANTKCTEDVCQNLAKEPSTWEKCSSVKFQF